MSDKTIITTVGFTDCKNCNFPPNKEGHDACLGYLPGVANACCGHGENEAYVQFDYKGFSDDPNKQRLSGDVAMSVMMMMKNQKGDDYGL